MKKKVKKLELAKETLRGLTQLESVLGGATLNTCVSCDVPFTTCQRQPATGHTCYC